MYSYNATLKTMKKAFHYILPAAACAKKNEPDGSKAAPGVTTLAASGAHGIDISGSLNVPMRVAAGNVYMADGFNNLIRKITL